MVTKQSLGRKAAIARRPAFWRSHAVPLLLSLLIAALGLLEPTASQWLRYDRTAILNGEIWRIVTGNIVHFGWGHLSLNLAGLLLLWFLFIRVIESGTWLLMILVGAVGVGIGILLFNPSIEWYVGLSGVLHTALAGGILLAIRAGERFQWLLLVFIAAKLAWEQVYGALPGSEETAGGPVLVDAHLYGAVTGVVLALLLIALTRRGSSHGAGAA